MKFIEMSGFKMLLTGCVLLLMLNCYQSYGDNFRVYYDTQSKTVKTERKPTQGTNISVISVDLSYIDDWADIDMLFSQAELAPIGITNGYYCMYFLYYSKIVEPLSLLSLCQQLGVKKSPLRKVYAFMRLGELHDRAFHRFSEAVRCYNEAMRVANDSGDRSMVAQAFLEFGWFYQGRGKFPEAEECFNNALRAARDTKNYVTLLHIYNGLGYVCREQGKLPDAEKCHNDYHKAFMSSTRYSDFRWLARKCREQGRLQDAEKYCKNIINRVTRSSNPNDEAWAFIELGEVYKQQGRLPEAEECFKKGIPVVEIAHNGFVRADFYNALGEVYKQQGRLPEAEECFHNALKADVAPKLKIFVNLGEVCNLQGKRPEAKRCFNDALSATRGEEHFYYAKDDPSLEVISANLRALEEQEMLNIPKITRQIPTFTTFRSFKEPIGAVEGDMMDLTP